MATQIVMRRDTAANWALANPILAAGEPGFNLDTQLFRVGDGVTHWTSLVEVGAPAVAAAQAAAGAAASAVLTAQQAVTAAQAAASQAASAVLQPIPYSASTGLYSPVSGTSPIPSIDPDTKRFPDSVRKAQSRTVAIPVGQGETVWNILDFGAYADSTHPTETRAAIQGAINAAISNGGSVYVPRGFFIINGTLSISGNVEIHGAGDEISTIGMDNGSNADMIQVALSVTGFVHKDLHLYGNKANNATGCGINFLDDTGNGYYGSGRIVRSHIDSFPQSNIRLGRHRSSAFLDTVTSGGSGQYGLLIGEDSQDNLISSPNFGQNTAAGIYVNGSNSVVLGGQIYGGTNLIIEDTRTSKFICTGSVLEGCQGDGVVINTSSSDDVNTHQYIGITMGRIGLSNPASYSFFKSATAARIIVSGHLYKKSTDTAPAYAFDIPATCIANIAGLAIQASAFAVALAKNGTYRFRGYDAGRVMFEALNSGPSISASTGSFTTVPLPTVVVDAANAFASNLYTIPVTGVYSISGYIRIADTLANGVNCAIGVESTAADSPTLIWSTGGSNRHTLHVARTERFVKGDQVRLLYYLDTATAMAFTSARLAITLVAAE